MIINAHFHGILADWVGTRSAVFELKEGDVYADLVNEIRQRFGANMPDQLWDAKKNQFHQTVRAFRNGKALDPTNFTLNHGDALTFYLMMAGG
jgi:molybdopterin converting factor small subunit